MHGGNKYDTKDLDLFIKHKKLGLFGFGIGARDFYYTYQHNGGDGGALTFQKYLIDLRIDVVASRILDNTRSGLLKWLERILIKKYNQVNGNAPFPKFTEMVLKHFIPPSVYTTLGTIHKLEISQIIVTIRSAFKRTCGYV